MNNVPEDLILHQQCCENIKSHRKITVLNTHIIKIFKNHIQIELNGWKLFSTVLCLDLDFPLAQCYKYWLWSHSSLQWASAPLVKLKYMYEYSAFRMNNCKRLAVLRHHTKEVSSKIILCVWASHLSLHLMHGLFMIYTSPA